MGKINKCIIISGAPESNLDYMLSYISENCFVIAADSGYLKLNTLKVEPDLLIGDFDSSKNPSVKCEKIILPSEKNDTDTLFCVKEAINRGFNDITILGGIGSRVDHTYSNILCSSYALYNGAELCIINNKNKIFAFRGKCTLKKSDGYKFFSLFSFGGKSCGITVKGAKYPLNNADLKPFSSLGQSNEFINNVVNIEVKEGTLLVILSND